MFSKQNFVDILFNRPKPRIWFNYPLLRILIAQIILNTFHPMCICIWIKFRKTQNHINRVYTIYFQHMTYISQSTEKPGSSSTGLCAMRCTPFSCLKIHQKWNMTANLLAFKYIYRYTDHLFFFVRMSPGRTCHRYKSSVDSGICKSYANWASKRKISSLSINR